MRITLPVTRDTLPRLNALRATPPAGAKPPTFEIREADVALAIGTGADPLRAPVGRWLVRSVGPIGLASTVDVDVDPYVAPRRPVRSG